MLFFIVARQFKFVQELLLFQKLFFFFFSFTLQYVVLLISVTLENVTLNIAKISVTSPIVINVPTRELLGGETKSSFV